MTAATKEESQKEYEELRSKIKDIINVWENQHYLNIPEKAFDDLCHIIHSSFTLGQKSIINVLEKPIERIINTL